MEEYCAGCGILLQEGVLNVMGGGSKNVKFKDGTYCEKCARIKVDKARKK